jgi:hypothetical protein
VCHLSPRQVLGLTIAEIAAYAEQNAEAGPASNGGSLPPGMTVQQYATWLRGLSAQELVRLAEEGAF